MLAHGALHTLLAPEVASIQAAAPDKERGFNITQQMLLSEQYCTTSNFTMNNITALDTSLMHTPAASAELAATCCCHKLNGRSCMSQHLHVEACTPKALPNQEDYFCLAVPQPS
jgi:hypothetical protein